MHLQACWFQAIAAASCPDCCGRAPTATDYSCCWLSMGCRPSQAGRPAAHSPLALEHEWIAKRFCCCMKCCLICHISKGSHRNTMRLEMQLLGIFVLQAKVIEQQRDVSWLMVYVALSDAKQRSYWNTMRLQMKLLGRRTCPASKGESSAG